MKSVGILPLRKGSKGIPGKNVKKLLGRPLYQWVLGEAIHSDLDEIYVFTDDDNLLDKINSIYSWTDKVKGHKRSLESASDVASTEYGMLELAKHINFDFDIYCLLQATSPLTTQNDINNVLNQVKGEFVDSALTVVPSKRFLWSSEGESLNYDYLARPRRQDFQGMLIENGAVYAIKKEKYRETNNRLGGNIAVVEMEDDTLIEIDEPSDWTIVEQILAQRMSRFKGPFSLIKALVLDVDGVFTPGTVNVTEDRELSKEFSLRDGMGLEIVRENGVAVIVMTSEDSPIVDRRMRKLGITHYYKWAKDKFSLLNQLCKELSIERNEIAYIGDDVNDLPNLMSVGWGMAPVDAVDIVKSNVDLVLHSKGGDKAIREGIDFILRMNARIKVK